MRRRSRTVRWATSCATAAMMLGALAALAVPAKGTGRPAAAKHPRLAGVSVFPMVHVADRQVTALPSGGYTPAQIRTAYDVRPLLRADINGEGRSIVIVDSFGSPTIRHDLRVFDRRFSLPAPSKLMIIHPAGPIPAFKATSTRIGWADETTLDVEWAHVMAPRARIVLVETPVSENEGRSGFPQIVTAERYVLKHRLGGVISQSFGATEQTFPKQGLRGLRAAYLEAARPSRDVTVVSASGDGGATDYRNNMTSSYTYPVTSWPASDPLVTAVGGLNLRLNRRGNRIAPDRVWNDPGSPAAGGGGKSIFFGRPAYQNRVAAVVGSRRGVPDISLSASCSHPVDIFLSFDGSGWQVICGTSEATPLFAGIIALADQVAGHPLGPINAALYKMATSARSGIIDVTRGNNTVSFWQGGKRHTVTGWAAVPGYDLSSGLGTIRAAVFVRKLVRFSNSAASASSAAGAPPSPARTLPAHPIP
jgi:subtilase family serine protease